MKNLSFILAALSLTGCNSGSGIDISESPMSHKAANTKTAVEYFEGQCLEFGFKHNTPGMAQCIQNQM
tara:strand:- start:50 stop:253 length:204 start_codon:yes stop_codon:yes gene_type:complete